MKRHGAELVFTERPFAGHGLPGWDGRLLNPDAIDRITGRRASNMIARVSYSRPYGSLDGYGEDATGHDRPYQITMQGHHRGGRRYGSYPTVTEAQAALVAWARRRFYVEA